MIYSKDTDSRAAANILYAIGQDELMSKEISVRCGLSPARVRDVLDSLVHTGRAKARPHPTIIRHPRPNLYSKA